MKEELLAQWKKDVEDYCDNAYKMWYGRLELNTHVMNASNNLDVETWLSFDDFVAVRKESAELPFDLERAKSGDDVEFYMGKSGLSDFEFPAIQVKFISESETFSGLMFIQDKYGYHHVAVDKLQMKYPLKVKK